MKHRVISIAKHIFNSTNSFRKGYKYVHLINLQQNGTKIISPFALPSRKCSQIDMEASQRSDSKRLIPPPHATSCSTFKSLGVLGFIGLGVYLGARLADFSAETLKDIQYEAYASPWEEDQDG